MAKDKRAITLASDHERASSRAFHSNDPDVKKLETTCPPLEEREWEETKCPICMEHPHNAVLLICSSREKGCHPYMCDTSYRHSNCLDQFRKSFPQAAVAAGLPDDDSLTRMHNHMGNGGERQRLSQPNRSLRGQGVELVCPLCRGQILGWVVAEDGRKYMNSKIRSCSLESCEFTGNYAELRKHARHEHPYLKPSDADPQRESDWARLQRERDLGDTLSAYQWEFGYDPDEDDLLGEEYQDYVSGVDVEAEWDSVDQFFTGIDVEAEDIQIEDGDTSVDLSIELEFSFSFLSDLSPWCPWDGNSSNTGSARTSSSSSGGLFNGRSTSRSRTRTQNASRRSRYMPYYSPSHGFDER